MKVCVVIFIFRMKNNQKDKEIKRNDNTPNDMWDCYKKMWHHHGMEHHFHGFPFCHRGGPHERGRGRGRGHHHGPTGHFFDGPRGWCRGRGHHHGPPHHFHGHHGRGRGHHHGHHGPPGHWPYFPPQPYGCSGDHAKQSENKSTPNANDNYQYEHFDETCQCPGCNAFKVFETKKDSDEEFCECPECVAKQEQAWNEIKNQQVNKTQNENK